MQRLDPSDRVGLRTVGVAQYFVGLTDFAPLNEIPFPKADHKYACKDEYSNPTWTISRIYPDVEPSSVVSSRHG
jgi:hypothetical protein